MSNKPVKKNEIMEIVEEEPLILMYEEILKKIKELKLIDEKTTFNNIIMEIILCIDFSEKLFFEYKKFNKNNSLTLLKNLKDLSTPIADDYFSVKSTPLPIVNDNNNNNNNNIKIVKQRFIPNFEEALNILNKLNKTNDTNEIKNLLNDLVKEIETHKNFYIEYDKYTKMKNNNLLKNLNLILSPFSEDLTNQNNKIKSLI